MKSPSSSHNAAAYYRKNSTLHGEEAEINNIFQSQNISFNPTEMDHVSNWIIERKISYSSFLDVGCAQLTLIRMVKRYFSHTVGVDISPYPNWKYHPEISKSVIDLDSGDLPFSENSFDVVSMLMVLEHIFNPFHAVREIRRVCKPDGFVIISVPNFASIRHRIRLLFGRLPITSARFSFAEDAWDGFHLHNFTMTTLIWLLLKEGLEPFAVRTQGKYQWLKRISPAFFGADLIVICKYSTPQPEIPFPN